MKFCHFRYMLLSVVCILGIGVTSSWAQIRVKGTVVDETGAGFIGAGVVQVGTTNGTTTDLDGNFELTVPEGAILQFSFINYVTQEIPAAPTMRVVLLEDTNLLDEIIVVGYGVQRKSSVTGAISSVKSTDIEHRSISNVQSALQGKTPGVSVVQSNAPGAAPAIRVRGFSSNNDAAPLYVVDGVRLSDISGIDPNDIESMEILKDAASAAIYGAQAGNGVVLITTKKGKAAENNWGTISFEYQYSSQSLSNRPRLLNSKEYIQYEAEKANMTIDEYTTNAKALGWNGTTDTNWYDASFENSHMSRYTLSLANGTDKGSYYIALTSLNDDGIIKQSRDRYNRLTGTINAEHKIKPWLTVGTSNIFERYKTRSVAVNATGYAGNVITSAMHMDPLTKPTYAENELTPEMRRALNDGWVLLQDKNGDYYGVSSFSDDQYNPLILINNNENSSEGWNVTGSAYLNLNPIKELTFTSRFGYRLSHYNSRGWANKYYAFSTASNDKINTSSNMSAGTYYQWENFANYNKTFGGVHNVTAMLGMSFTKNQSDNVDASLADSKGDVVLIPDPYLFGDISNGIMTSDTKGVGGRRVISTSTSYYGRVGYSYADKYMVQASLRADAYDLSKLPKSNRWGYFPAVSVGWTVTREDFMDFSRNWLDDLKIRASWGQNGSINALHDYLYSNDMTTGHAYPFPDGKGGYTLIQGQFPSTLGNDELRWETSEQFDLGFDARFLKGRLTLGFDYFDKKTKDLLVTGVTASLIAGGTASPLNAGNVTNSGVEIDLGWQDDLGDFHYSIRGNIATLKNKVTYLHPSITRINGLSTYNNLKTVFEKGSSVWHFYGYEFDYIDGNGDPVFKDVDGDGSISENDKTDIGDAIPDFTYGITLSAEYKGFDFIVFGTGSKGNQIYNAYARTDGQSTYNVVKSMWYDGRWTPGTASGIAKFPGAANDIGNYCNSSAMVFDASFFKIKQIQLGYTLPKTALNAIFAKTCRVYCSLEDFFTFTKYPGLDPEAAGGSGSGMGVDVGVYPPSKKIMFGINVSF